MKITRSAPRILVMALALLGLALGSLSAARAETIARCGRGWLERVDGCLVLHVAGTPYEMGYQHGVLLKDHVRDNARYLLDEKGGKPVKLGPVPLYPVAAIYAIAHSQRSFVPAWYDEELAGVAAGADEPLDRIRACNFIPELFHCSGFAVMNSATSDGTLYHGRVLDYAVDWRLQNHAVIIVASPEGKIPFVNISYAGFIGSVTGMNAQNVSIGEMGGGGRGHWAGVPMAILVRETLQQAGNLEQAIALFRDQKRTCEYYYVIADGKTNEAVGIAARWDDFATVKPGEAHPRLPTPVADAVLISAGKRYEELVRRAQGSHGSLTEASALRLMDCPVAMRSNLHNVLFAPRSTKFWVANASEDGQPAAEQKYHAFQLSELLRREPDGSAPALAPPPAARPSTASAAPVSALRSPAAIEASASHR